MSRKPEKVYDENQTATIKKSNPFLTKSAIVDIANEYGFDAKLSSDLDNEMPFIECIVNFSKFVENQYSINVVVETGSGIMKVMHLPPFHRLVSTSIPAKSELMLLVTSDKHRISFQNANQPKILFLDGTELSHLWRFSYSRKVFHKITSPSDVVLLEKYQSSFSNYIPITTTYSDIRELLQIEDAKTDALRCRISMQLVSRIYEEWFDPKLYKFRRKSEVIDYFLCNSSA